MGAQQILSYFSHRKLELVGSGSETYNFVSERIQIHNTGKLNLNSNAFTVSLLFFSSVDTVPLII